MNWLFGCSARARAARRRIFSDGGAWARHTAQAAQAVGSPASARRAVRGGSWNNPTAHCRPGYRNNNAPDNRNNNLGFRVVCCHIPRPTVGTLKWGGQAEMPSGHGRRAEPVDHGMARVGPVLAQAGAHSQTGRAQDACNPARPTLFCQACGRRQVKPRARAAASRRSSGPARPSDG